LVETDRSGMIAEYVGQTAIKVNKLVDSALHGVLFIDEAYAILIDDKDTYGREAIATLLKRMEDDRDKLIVVLAGYTGEMTTFIASNPGLKSRFNKYIFFPDYTADELYSIFIGMTRKLHFILEATLIDKLKLRFSEEIQKGDSSFGNGRFVRNMFEKMIENQANRLAYDNNLTKEKLTTLKEIDLPVML
jgi:SpoVK/Ycf46/Vps4 family AAA+-type ATPase